MPEVRERMLRAVRSPCRRDEVGPRSVAVRMRGVFWFWGGCCGGGDVAVGGWAGSRNVPSA